MSIYCFKAFLFDLDDTLVDTAQVVYSSMKKWCVENNIDLGVALETGKGGRTEDTVSIIAPHLDAKKEAKKIEAFEASLLQNLQPINGAAKFLKLLPRSKWAIVTSSSSSVAQLKLRASNLTEPDVLISADCVSRGKPDPEPFEKAIERLGVTPEDCLVFEDADNGINSALSAGCKVVVIGKNCNVCNANIITRVENFNRLELIVGDCLQVKLNEGFI